jgi:fibronectin type 3 domain-containing protein
VKCKNGIKHEAETMFCSQSHFTPYASRLTRRHVSLLVYCCLLSAFCCLFASACGRKGQPTLKSYEKPAPPSGLSAIHQGSEILLSWEFPEDKELTLKGFYLMRSSGGDFEKLAFLDNDKRSYSDTTFKTGTIYKYKVVAVNLRGIIGKDSNIITVKPEAPPSPPGKVSYKVERDSLIITWESAGAGVLYNVYKSYKQGVYALRPLNKEPLAETSFTDKLDTKKVVYYTVRSLRGNAWRDEGNASGEIKIDPSEFVPSSPENLKTVATEESVYLTWKEPPETWVTGYKVYRKIEGEKDFKPIGETPIPSFIDKEAPLTKRNYRVTAIGPSKEGPPAEIDGVIFIEQR